MSSYFKTGVLACVLMLSGVEPVLGAAESVCQKTLILGWDEFRPYTFTYRHDGKSQATGVDVDLFQLIMKEMGCQFESQQWVWPDALQKIQNGQIDVVSSATHNPNRSEYAYFSEPYLKVGTALLTRKSEMGPYVGIQKVSEFKKYPSFKLGVVGGYDYGDGFQALEQDPSFQKQLHHFSKLIDGLHALERGQIDGLLEDPLVLSKVAKAVHLEKAFTIHPMVDMHHNVYFMFSQKTCSPEFLTAFNQTLDRLKQSGEYQQVLKRYN